MALPFFFWLPLCQPEKPQWQVRKSGAIPGPWQGCHRSPARWTPVSSVFFGGLNMESPGSLLKPYETSGSFLLLTADMSESIFYCKLSPEVPRFYFFLQVWPQALLERMLPDQVSRAEPNWLPHLLFGAPKFNSSGLNPCALRQRTWCSGIMDKVNLQRSGSQSNSVPPAILFPFPG